MKAKKGTKQYYCLVPFLANQNGNPLVRNYCKVSLR